MGRFERERLQVYCDAHIILEEQSMMKNERFFFHIVALNS